MLPKFAQLKILVYRSSLLFAKIFERFLTIKVKAAHICSHWGVRIDIVSIRVPYYSWERALGFVDVGILSSWFVIGL